jgi:hypothetical protein
VVKIFFQPGVNINGALAQVTAASQTVLKLLPPGITPPYVLTFNASSVPILQLALSSKTLSQSLLFDDGQNFIRPQLATIAGAAIPSPYAGKVRQVQVDINQDISAEGLDGRPPVNAVSRRRRWPKASVYRGLSFHQNRPPRSVPSDIGQAPVVNVHWPGRQPPPNMRGFSPPPTTEQRERAITVFAH